VKKIHQVIEAVIGLRKLFFTAATISIIAACMGVATALFVTNWYLGAFQFQGNHLVDVYQYGFQYIAVIAGGYLAVNVANKWVEKWVKKK